MNAKNMTRTIIVVLIVALLAGAYLIVAKNQSSVNGSRQETPSGVLH